MNNTSKNLAYPGFGVSWNPRKGLTRRYLGLCALLSGVSIVLSWMAVLTIPGGFLGVGDFYFASIFYAVCTYWFGGWGLISSFIGAFVGSGLLTGMPVVFALPFAISDIWEPLIPFLFLRLIGTHIGLDPLGSNIFSKPWYKFALFILFGAIVPPFISGLWGTWILDIAGFIPTGAFWVAIFKWWLGAAILLLLLVPLICKVLAGFLRESGLACKGIWS